jgi:riboflavin kinase/FMN adenylyltransferase
MMRDHLRLDSLWVGADFAMGYKREGNIEFLKAQGAEKGFTLHLIDMVMCDGDQRISSTGIREALLKGDVDRARTWLGRSYALSGEVVHGDHRGRGIGFPTANIAVWDQQVIPANGIYAGWAILNGERSMAATNVGVRPTFDGQNITVEAYLLDFDRMIYGETLAFAFEKYLRPEARYESLDALIAQIAIDVQHTREFLSSTPHP